MFRPDPDPNLLDPDPEHCIQMPSKKKTYSDASEGELGALHQPLLHPHHHPGLHLSLYLSIFTIQVFICIYIYLSLPFRSSSVSLSTYLSYLHTYEERQVTMPTSRFKGAVHVTDFDTLIPAPELSLADARNNSFRNLTTQLYRERQLWSGDENVEIRYVIGSSVAGTLASSPSVPCQMQLQVLKRL